MDLTSYVPLLLGSSWASGINLYLTTAGLGLAHRMGYLTLPGELETLANPFIIGLALLIYAVEFFADKIPYVDSAWDSVHTFIRPAGGMAMGYMALNGADPMVQIPVALLTGTIALDSHLTKATSRAAINTSPEPVTNTVASVTEDIGVLGALYLIINHPLIISILVIIFILFSFWFLKKMFHLVKKIFKGGQKPTNSTTAKSQSTVSDGKKS